MAAVLSVEPSSTTTTSYGWSSRWRVRQPSERPSVAAALCAGTITLTRGLPVTARVTGPSEITEQLHAVLYLAQLVGGRFLNLRRGPDGCLHSLSRRRRVIERRSQPQSLIRDQFGRERLEL